MKPDKAASGVRNSWLALATKSARISSTRRNGDRSRNVRRKLPAPNGRALPAAATGVTTASHHRSVGMRSENSTRSTDFVFTARATASTSSGIRNPIDGGSLRRKPGATARAAELNATT